MRIFQQARRTDGYRRFHHIKESKEIFHQTVTPIGRFMRKTSIDEFPQFINIFKGDMSLVGTRPPTVDEHEATTNEDNERIQEIEIYYRFIGKVE